MIVVSATGIQPSFEANDTSAHDLQVIIQRRLSNIVGATTGETSITSWLASLGADGKWPDTDVNYATGCDANPSNWPAQQHWKRIVTFSAAWHGGLKKADQWVANSDIRSAISSAMNFWFENDLQNPACLDSGGEDACPCSTPGFWNTNWFENVITIPTFVGEACLLLNTSLSASELGNCTRMTGRTYATFTTGINGVSAITGANLLDIASIGIDESLLLLNLSRLADGYRRVHEDLVVQNETKADGIRADGTFGQHAGLLYNGNYGRIYGNDVLDLEIEAGDTQFQASLESRNAFEIFWKGNQWMIFRNVVTNVLHWDFSVIGRYISFPVADNQSSAKLSINSTQVEQLGSEWNSSVLADAFNSLSMNTTNANAGELRGNMMFFANDYMVHRGPGFVMTLKMYSNRTQNSECVNAQNPSGFHLSDGALYTYLQGDEYEDIAASWDWNLIPGTTVDYNVTSLNCTSIRHTGVEAFVGGASDGSAGVAVMTYQNPLTKGLRWKKAWFFLDNNTQHVMIASVNSTTSAPVFSILDQRRRAGSILINGMPQGSGNFTGVRTLWHGGVGYVFSASNSTPVSLSVETGNKTGDWAGIGTSKQPPTTVDLFAAWLIHDNDGHAVDFAIYPATDPSTFTSRSSSHPQVLQNDGTISALQDTENSVIMLVFWEVSGGSTTVPSNAGRTNFTVLCDSGAVVILRMDTWLVTVAEPTQTLSVLNLEFDIGPGVTPEGWTAGSSHAVSVLLPGGGLAGSSKSFNLFTSD